MKKIIVFFIIFTACSPILYAQEVNNSNHKPCYTRHWVDSVNARSIHNFNSIAPMFVEWYAYEGQTQQMTLPPNVVNIIFIKPETTCPPKVN